jgi:hypothetical protein
MTENEMVETLEKWLVILGDKANEVLMYKGETPMTPAEIVKEIKTDEKYRKEYLESWNELNCGVIFNENLLPYL